MILHAETSFVTFVPVIMDEFPDLRSLYLAISNHKSSKFTINHLLFLCVAYTYFDILRITEILIGILFQ